MRTCNCSQTTGIRRFLIVAALFCALAAVPASAEETDWAALAAHWAPVVAQGMVFDFRMDVIAAADYDGDWHLSNNPEPHGVVPSVVYYWVTETAGYYYLGYALYHIGGGTRGVDGNTSRFDNDMHGIVLAIRKVEGQPMGQFLALRSWGTDTPVFYADQWSPDPDTETAGWQARYVSETAPAGEMVGDIDFVIDTLGFHPVIYSRAGHHVVVGEKAQSQFPEGPPIFEEDHIVDWRYVPTIVEGGKKELRHRQHRPGNAKISGGESGVPMDDGVLYRYEGEAMAVVGPRSKGKGTMLHHWNLIAYDLEPISPLWERRLDEETFADYGVFASEGEPGPSSRAPWAWGAIFFDPAEAFAGVLPEASADGAGKIVATSFESPDTLAEEYATRVTPL